MAYSKLTRRERLHKEDPLCFWCGRLTMLNRLAPFRNESATVDHLLSRLNPNRGLAKGRLVLACFDCNQRRAAAENSGQTFVPALPSRLEIAREHCAIVAKGQPLRHVPLRQTKSRRVAPANPLAIDTLEKARAFAKSHPYHRMVRFSDAMMRAGLVLTEPEIINGYDGHNWERGMQKLIREAPDWSTTKYWMREYHRLLYGSV